jgi:nitrate/nitrite-specific signal transduction histidine kinase
MNQPSTTEPEHGDLPSLGTPSLQHLKWLTILAPLLFFGLLDFLQQVLLRDAINPLISYLAAVTIILVGTLVFSEMIFGVIHRMQQRLVQQNRELLALHQAGLDIAGELELEVVLQKIVDRARELVGARFGALSLRGDGGDIVAYLTSGSTGEMITLPAETKRSGDHQSLVPSDEPTRASPNQLPFTSFPDALGTRSLVMVPILSRGQVLGNLYVTHAAGDRGGFTPDDEKTLLRFATQAALAIENARMHRRIQALAVTAEREWIARELHDTLAQVLGYVNTKAQAVQELIRTGQTERAAMQIGQLVEAARAAYADVREGILGLRTSIAFGRGFRATVADYLEQWQEQSGVTAHFRTTLEAEMEPPLSPLAEIQLLRILQEALANVRKHARATRVEVELAATGEAVELTIADNGTGFDSSALRRAGFPRFGLATMRERAEAIGGRLTIDTAPGRGTRVVVSIPRSPLAGASSDGGPHAYLNRG